MSTSDPVIREPSRFSMRLPRPLWIGVAAVVLVVVAAGLQVGTPMYGQHVAICEIERLKGIVTTKKGGPAWLRRWLGDERMRMLDDVTELNAKTANHAGEWQPNFRWRSTGIQDAQ